MAKTRTLLQRVLGNLVTLGLIAFRMTLLGLVLALRGIRPQ